MQQIKLEHKVSVKYCKINSFWLQKLNSYYEQFQKQILGCYTCCLFVMVDQRRQREQEGLGIKRSWVAGVHAREKN